MNYSEFKKLSISDRRQIIHDKCDEFLIGVKNTLNLPEDYKFTNEYKDKFYDWEITDEMDDNVRKLIGECVKWRAEYDFTLDWPFCVLRTYFKKYVRIVTEDDIEKQKFI